ncbi:HPr kinase/phosphorylase [Paracoccus sp. (in: a-proteobacteria)]|uniref:HPr kinase/phosphorylase n=1 Tax=Paracoccus sp. TaxID=267 RepID=UPI0026E07A1D|nr:HPr kinase/phosphatase C-terminal domain-containing protein [Paracoccus sp. (in: a-proteobacteria)]MDO5647140.1 HPr kinase/phosphatase C-terminal domain-containing protein [Paracoccus sp. (in: a-proteobacteria)]
MEQIHGTTVAIDGAGLLIIGPSGAGKSTVALQLMAVGAQLVADDRTDLHRQGDSIIASAPAPLRGMIEARGIGLLAATPAPPTRLALICDLGGPDPARLPQLTQRDMAGVPVPLVKATFQPHLYAALRQYLIGGRIA